MSTSKFPRRPLSERSPYHLDEFREREIIYFCLQYPGWRKKLNHYKLLRSQGEWSDPVGDEATERAMLERNMKIVEDACKRVSEDQWNLILNGVTDPDSNWYNFKSIKGLKCGRDAYYNFKHQVYFYVNLKDSRESQAL